MFKISVVISMLVDFITLLGKFHFFILVFCCHDLSLFRDFLIMLQRDC